MTTNQQKTIVSGLDMAPTIAWYNVNSAMIYNNLPDPRRRAPLEYQLAGNGCLTREQINACIKLFPASAIQRMKLAKVERLPPRWFHRDSAGGKPSATEDRDEALSPTALIPSYVDHETTETTWFSRVELYDLPTDLVPEHVALIMWLQGCIHECAHTIITHELYRDVFLVLRDGRRVKAVTYLVEEMLALFNDRPPISHYASAYFGANGRLREDDGETFIRALNENMAEAITARLLKFAFQPDGNGLDPFGGRADLRQVIDAYLHAERVS